MRQLVDDSRRHVKRVVVFVKRVKVLVNSIIYFYHKIDKLLLILEKGIVLSAIASWIAC